MYDFSKLNCQTTLNSQKNNKCKIQRFIMHWFTTIHRQIGVGDLIF